MLQLYNREIHNAQCKYNMMKVTGRIILKRTITTIEMPNRFITHWMHQPVLFECNKNTWCKWETIQIMKWQEMGMSSQHWMRMCVYEPRAGGLRFQPSLWRHLFIPTWCQRWDLYVEGWTTAECKQREIKRQRAQAGAVWHKTELNEHNSQ